MMLSEKEEATRVRLWNKLGKGKLTPNQMALLRDLMKRHEASMEKLYPGHAELAEADM